MGKIEKTILFTFLLFSIILSPLGQFDNSVFAQTGNNIPTVTTRGHVIDDSQTNDPTLRDQNNPEHFDVIGTIPGYQNDNNPDSIVIYVHGWNNDENEAQENFNTVKSSLRLGGYSGPIVGYSWDSDLYKAKFWDAESVAKLNGPKLAKFISDYRSHSPNTEIHVMGHSLGSQVILNSIQSLANDNSGQVISTVQLFGAAVDAESIHMGGNNFGQAIETVVGDFYNKVNSKDPALKAFDVMPFGDSLGGNGASCTTNNCPSNFYEDDVTETIGHSHNYVKNYNLMSKTVDEWTILDFRCQTGLEEACIDLGYCSDIPCAPPVIASGCTSNYPYLWSDGWCYEVPEGSDEILDCPSSHPYLWSDGWCYEVPEGSDEILDCPSSHPYLWSDGWCYEVPEGSDEILDCPSSHPYLWSDGWCYEVPEGSDEILDCPSSHPYLWSDGWCYDQPQELSGCSIDYPYLHSDGTCWNIPESLLIEPTDISPTDISPTDISPTDISPTDITSGFDCPVDYPYLWSDGFCYDQPEGLSCPPGTYDGGDGFCYNYGSGCDEGYYDTGYGYCCPAGTSTSGDGYCDDGSDSGCPPGTYDGGDGYCYDDEPTCPSGTYDGGDGWCYEYESAGSGCVDEGYYDTGYDYCCPYGTSTPGDGYCYDDEPTCPPGTYDGGDGYCYEYGSGCEDEGYYETGYGYCCPYGTSTYGDGYCYDDEPSGSGCVDEGYYDTGYGYCCPSGTYTEGDGYCYDPNELVCDDGWYDTMYGYCCPYGYYTTGDGMCNKKN